MCETSSAPHRASTARWRRSCALASAAEAHGRRSDDSGRRAAPVTPTIADPRIDDVTLDDREHILLQPAQSLRALSAPPGAPENGFLNEYEHPQRDSKAAVVNANGPRRAASDRWSLRPTRHIATGRGPVRHLAASSRQDATPPAGGGSPQRRPTLAVQDPLH
jgi:hypothetical protein